MKNDSFCHIPVLKGANYYDFWPDQFNPWRPQCEMFIFPHVWVQSSLYLYGHRRGWDVYVDR